MSASVVALWTLSRADVYENAWSTSSWVWPTGKKPISTLSNTEWATNISQYPMTKLFLFSLVQLSNCINKCGGNVVVDKSMDHFDDVACPGFVFLRHSVEE